MKEYNRKINCGQQNYGIEVEVYGRGLSRLSRNLGKYPRYSGGVVVKSVALPVGGEDGVVKSTEAASPTQHNTGSASSSPLGGDNRGASPYKVYNIGNSSPVPLMEYIAAIEKTLGKEAQKEFLPMQPGDVPRTEADVTDLVENLGYKPNTAVSIGIEKFIEWYKSYFLE